MVFVNSSLLMTLGVCSVYDLRYRRIPAIVVAITTLYIAVALGVMGCLTPIRIVGAAVLCTFLELLCIASRDKIKDLEIPLAPYLLVGVGVVLFAEVLQ